MYIIIHTFNKAKIFSSKIILLILMTHFLRPLLLNTTIENDSPLFWSFKQALMPE